MLYPTLNQPLVFLFIFLTGLASGLLFDLANFLLVFVNKNKIMKQIFYFISTIFSFALLFITNLFCNFGQFRFFVILTFLFALIIERFTLGKFINKTINKTTNIKRKLSKLKRKNKKEA